MNFSDRLLIASFGGLMLLMLSLTAITYQLSHDANTRLNSVVQNQLIKLNLARKMQFIGQARTDSLQSMLLIDDVFKRDETWTYFIDIAQYYIKSREQFIALLSAEEQELMLEIDLLANEIVSSHHQSIDFLQDGDYKSAKNILLNQVLEKNKKYLTLFSSLSELQISNAQMAVDSAKIEFLFIRKTLSILATLSLILGMVIAYYVIRKRHHLTRQLESANANLELKVNERTADLQNIQSQLRASNKQLKKLATTDDLTGLFNRNYMNSHLAKELSRFKRYHKTFGIIMMDVDHFKQINDQFGHDIGDKVLSEIARQLQKGIRTNDAIARWGGEEFLACCSEINTSSLQAIAENLRQTINHLIINDIPDTDISISLGCSVIDNNGNILQLIKQADTALYLAKDNGRNRVEMASLEVIENASVATSNVTSIDRNK